MFLCTAVSVQSSGMPPLCVRTPVTKIKMSASIASIFANETIERLTVTVLLRLVTASLKLS